MPHPLAIQLYSLRAEFQRDPQAAFRNVPNLGFQAIETAGDYGWSPAQWREMMAECGLTAAGAHIGFGAFLSDPSKVLEFLDAIDACRIIIPAPGPGEKNTALYQNLARQLNQWGKDLDSRGFKILYHNHAFEFETLSDGGTGMQILFDESDPELVNFEIDTYWVERGGKNSREFVEAHAGRIGMIHAKELRKRDGADVPAGEGDIDFPAIAKLAMKRDWPVVVEYEGEHAPAAVAASAAYLKPLLVS
jgi:sugar phosphate isomerase/epimerase